MEILLEHKGSNYSLERRAVMFGSKFKLTKLSTQERKFAGRDGTSSTSPKWFFLLHNSFHVMCLWQVLNVGQLFSIGFWLIRRGKVSRHYPIEVEKRGEGFPLSKISQKPCQSEVSRRQRQHDGEHDKIDTLIVDSRYVFNYCAGRFALI